MARRADRIRVESFLPLASVSFEILLARLVDVGLIAERDDRARAADDDERRYYSMTPLGQQVAQAEARRLLEQVRTPRQKKILRKEVL